MAGSRQACKFRKIAKLRTVHVEVGAEALAVDAPERRLHRARGNVPDRVLEARALDRVVVPEVLEVIRSVHLPECGEAALLQEAVQRGQLREERGERVGLVERSRGRPVVEEGDTQVEVREGGLHERFDEDINDHVRVVQVRVKLISASQNEYSTFKREGAEPEHTA